MFCMNTGTEPQIQSWVFSTNICLTIINVMNMHVALDTVAAAERGRGCIPSIS